MSAWLKETTFKSREEFRDYVFGLIRYEIHNGEDDEKRLQVLNQIYHDLLYKEDLRDSPNWKKGAKGEDELSLVLSKLEKAMTDVNNYRFKLERLLEYINNGRTKKEIIDFADQIKKSV